MPLNVGDGLITSTMFRDPATGRLLTGAEAFGPNGADRADYEVVPIGLPGERVGSVVASGEPGAILHLEGAEPIEPGLGNLEAWVERGLRSVGITWSRPNAYGHGVPFRHPGTPDTGPAVACSHWATRPPCQTDRRSRRIHWRLACPGSHGG